MAKITIVEEQLCRSAIVADIDAIDLSGNVFNRRRKITSRMDFFDKLGVDVGAGDGMEREIRFVDVDLLNIEDSPDEGPDDCPVAVLTYNLHLFHEFADERPDGSNSDRDFTDLQLRLRTHYLDEREFTIPGWEIQLQPLQFPEFTQFGNDTFTDVKGYYKDLTLIANFYDV